MDQTLSILTSASVTTLALVATSAAVVGLLWVSIATSDRRTSCIAALILGLLVETMAPEQTLFQAGLQIYVGDLVSLMLLTTVIVGFTRRPLPITQGPFLIWLTFGAVMLASFGAGLGPFGKTAGTELRPNFYFWTAGLFCCTANFDEAQLRRIARWCVWGAYALIGVALFRWAGVLVGLLPRSFVYLGAVNEFRPVGSPAAFCLAAAGLVQVMLWLRGTGTRWSGFHAIAFIGAVIILQHRSVWTAFLVGMLYLLIQERRHLPRRLPLLFGFALLACASISLAVAFGLLDTLFERLVESIVSIGGRSSTFTARVDGWERLMGEWMDSSVRTILLGFPYGTGFRRVIGGIVIEFAPHNFYFDMLLRVGIVGCALFLLATSIATVHSLRAKVDSEFEYVLTRGLGLMLIASTVYYLAYPAFDVNGAVTGLALAQVMRHAQLREQRLRVQPSWQSFNKRTAR